MTEQEIQQAKLFDTVNKIYLLLHGQDGQTGLAGTVNKHEDSLYGTPGTMGIQTLVSILWRGHVWLYCSMSAALGSLATFYLQNHFQK